MATKKRPRRKAGLFAFVDKLRREVKARAEAASELGIPLAGSPINRSGYQVISPTMEARRQELTFSTPPLQELTKPWES